MEIEIFKKAELLQQQILRKKEGLKVFNSKLGMKNLYIDLVTKGHCESISITYISTDDLIRNQIAYIEIEIEVLESEFKKL